MTKFDDAEMTARIKLAMLVSPRIGALDISVDSLNGIVFLKGVVQERGQRMLAEEIAREHGGIDIKNDIQVLGELEEAEVEEEQEVDEKMLQEDVSLRTRILGDMESDSRVNALMVNVYAAGGLVRLSGIQETQTARRRAEEIARKVDGVIEVINDIEVRSSVTDQAA